MITALALLALVASVTLNIFLLGGYMRVSERARHLDRGRHIAELERSLDLDQNLATLRTSTASMSPALQFMAALVGIWAAERLRSRR